MNKGYETRMKVTKLEERYKISMKICETTKRKFFFRFAKQLETFYFVFSEMIETRRNSDLFRTVLYFAKLKKYETVKPSENANCMLKT